jgi:DNA-directed RNA polymerase delta subunit
VDTYDQILNVIYVLFEKERRPFVFEEVYNALRSIRPDALEKEHFESYLKTSSMLAVNPFGHWGLLHWPEVNPKSTRDKAYLVLKYEKSPLHFRDIARRIDEHGLGRRKMTNPQTVHNELIKDPVFSLVGRGVYGLREWGHEGGTVRDAIEKILKVSKRPMSRREICDEVSREKAVKATTILINLNMHFKKVGKDLYALPTR